jgi:hypothetical protein
LATLVCLWGIRKIRGRNEWCDLFIPFLLLTPSLCTENWNRGWNGCNTIPVSLLLIAGTILITWSAKPSFSRICSLVLCLIALPLCGIGHVVTGSCLAFVSIVPMIALLKSQDANTKFKGLLLFCGIVITVFLSIFYFVGYETPVFSGGSQGITPALIGAFYLYFAGLLGPLFNLYPMMIVAMFLMFTALVYGIFLLIKNFYCNNSSRLKVFLTASVLLSAGLLIGGIGWGRNSYGLLNITSSRLVSFALPAQIFLYMIFTMYAVSIMRRLMVSISIGVLFVGIISSLIVPVNSIEYSIRKKVVDDIWEYRLAEVLINQPSGWQLLSQHEM